MAFNQGLNAVTGAIGNAFNAYQRLERPIDALSYRAVPRTPKAQHLAGTALEQIGSWMPWTVAASAAGALGSDLASSNPTAQYSADWTQRMLHGDAVGATDEYFPTSAAELKRLDQSGVPVVSQIAHQARNHPKITGALTTLAMLGSPNLEGHIVDAMRIAGQRAAPVIARNAGRAGRATWRATGLPGTPVGNAAEGAARKVGHYGNVVKEAARRSFGTPAIDLLNTVPNNPEARNSVQNKGMAFLHAQGSARSTAANATKYAFRPRHRATADAVGPGRWVGGGSSPEEAAIAIHLRQNLAFHEAFDTAPQPIQDAATAMNASWEKFKANPANEKQIADAYMAELPRDATGKPIWSAMDISFAPDEFIEREANVKGIPEAQHGAVYTAARNQFLALQGQAQLDAAIARLSPASQVNVARMAGGIKKGYEDYEAAAKATDPSLLPNERVGYFPAYDTLEETPEQAAERAAPTGSRGAKSMSRPYRRHAKYGSISQMQAAGLDPFSGLSPVDAMYRDLAKKYGDVHKARAFATLGAQVGHRGETLLNRQEYRDPETGETLDYAEAHRRAKQRFLDRSRKAAAANMGYDLDPRTMRPTILPARIENPASAKARLEEATREAKGQQKLQNQLGTEGTRAVDATVKDSLKKEDAAEKLGEKVDAHGNAIKAAHYEQTETTRQAWEQQRDRTKTAIATARARLAASPNSTALQAQIKGLEKHLARLEDALSGGDAYQAPLYGPEEAPSVGKLGQALDKTKSQIAALTSESETLIAAIQAHLKSGDLRGVETLEQRLEKIDQELTKYGEGDRGKAPIYGPEGESPSGKMEESNAFRYQSSSADQIEQSHMRGGTYITLGEPGGNDLYSAAGKKNLVRIIFEPKNPLYVSLHVGEALGILVGPEEAARIYRSANSDSKAFVAEVSKLTGTSPQGNSSAMDALLGHIAKEKGYDAIVARGGEKAAFVLEPAIVRTPKTRSAARKTEAQLTQENLAKGVTRAQDSAKGKVGRAAEKARKVISGRSVRTSSDVAKFTQRLKDLHKASIGLSQDARHRLEAIARKYADAGNNRYLELKLREQLARMDTATLAKFKAKVEEIQALANEDEGQVASIVKDEYKAGNPNSGYQVRDPHYRNAQDLKAIIGNIPNLDPDHRIARDAYDFFVHNQMPPRVASEFAKMMSQLDSVGKMGVVYYPVQHAGWNLGMHYIAKTRDLIGWVTALPMLIKTGLRFDKQWDAWTQEKAATLDRLKETGVLQEGGFLEPPEFARKPTAQRDSEGRIIGYDTAKSAEERSSSMQRMVTRTSELPGAQQIQKILEMLGRFNSKIVFDRFEKWYSAKLYEHEIAKGSPPPIAARAVRNAFSTDLITPFEKSTFQHIAWFYPWVKTVLPFAIAVGIHDPTWWNAFVQGARVEREGEGAGDMRRSSPFTYVGKDPRGGFDTFTPSLPQRILEIPANMLIKTPGESNIDRYEPGFNFLDTHLNPLAGTALGAAEEVGTRGKTPGYSQPFDPNAGPLQAAGQVGAHLLGGYINPAKQAADFTKEVVKDPGGFIGDILSHLAVLNKGYRLQGDNVGGEAPGSPAARYWAGYDKIDRTFKPFAPGAKHENAAVYARKQAALERLYQRYPMMRP